VNAIHFNKSWGVIALYLVLAAVLSSIFWAFAIATGHSAGGHGAYAVGVMWCPGLAAVLTCKLSGVPLVTLGWRWGEWRWQALAYLWPLAACGIAYTLVWATGLGGFPNAATVASTRLSLGWTGAPDWLVVSGWFFLFATTGEVRGIASALGEEIGWRGFLAPRLDQKLGFTSGAIMTGVIWAVWHFPILLFSDYDSATPRWFAMPCFLVLVLSLSVGMSWLRLRSGSLWTGAIAHASINLFNQGFFAPMTSTRGSVTAYSIDESGFMLPVVLALFGLAFWLMRGRLGGISFSAGDRLFSPARDTAIERKSARQS
jgi:membrane protease YdiL (CAAX protease family)